MSHRAVSRGLAIAFVTAGFGIAHGCSNIVVHPIEQSVFGSPGDVGEPCLPDDEHAILFGGFNLNQVYLVSNDFNACKTGMCLINHFQGRVSCPLGQPAPTPCKGIGDDAVCAAGEHCVEAGVVPVPCDPLIDGQCDPYGGTCNGERKSCECSEDAHCPSDTFCDADTKACKRYVCRNDAAECQSFDASDENNAGKICCTPGTDKPIAEAVCGQCASKSKRDAENAVYCSCRCGSSEFGPPEEDADYCTCPDGFECKEIIPYIGFGDPALTGQFCVKAATSYQDPTTCGMVSGNVDGNMCFGNPVP